MSPRPIDALFLSAFEDLDRWHNDHVPVALRGGLTGVRPAAEHELDAPTDSGRQLRQSVGIDGRRYDLPRFLSWVAHGTTAFYQRYDTFTCTHLSGSYYRSLLGGAGWEVEHVQPANRVVLEALRERIEPRWVLLSTTFLADVPQILDACQRLRRAWPSAGLVLGGLMLKEIAGSVPERSLQSLLRSCGADAYVISATGERALLEILAHEPRDLPRLALPETWVRGPDGYRLASGEERAIPMDETWVRWSRLAPGSLYHTVSCRTARSCAFRCAFCTFPALQGELETMAPATFEHELRELRANGAVRSILFSDDTFNVPPTRFRELCDVLARFDFEWYSFIRVQHLDEDIVARMADSGCRAVFLGIESADDAMLKRMEKSTTMKAARRGARLLKERGIAVHANFIIGFPGDVDENTRKIVPYLEETGADFFGVSPWYYNHTAPVHRRAAELGLSGGSWSWKHATMDSRRACELEAELLAQPKHARFLSDLTANSFWGGIMLLANGFTVEEVRHMAWTYERLCGRDRAEGELRARDDVRALERILRARALPDPPPLPAARA